MELNGFPEEPEGIPEKQHSSLKKSGGLPDKRTERGLESLEKWCQAGIYFVPIRHHSPGCARALTALLEEVAPSTVLIEGPREYSALLPALADGQTRPPIAVLSLHENASGFYPMAEFSPEWVALRWATANNAAVDFIDQSWADRSHPEDPGAAIRTMQREHYLAQSDSLGTLAARMGCRDYNELWEHLFEVRESMPHGEHNRQANSYGKNSPTFVSSNAHSQTKRELETRTRGTDWREFFAEVFVWCAMSRVDVERQTLDADGTHSRESVMSTMIRRHQETTAGPIVVVTGGFHTLALLESLDGTPEGEWIGTCDPTYLDPTYPAWLIRYDLERLDELSGYGAGMPSPGFWQRVWNSGECEPRQLIIEVLLDVATELRAAGEQLSTAEVAAAAEQTLRLMDLRGRPRPGRTDLLDAMQSCFVREENDGALGRAVAKVFANRTLGELPPGLASPPLVTEVRELATALRFRVEDSNRRVVNLDTARKPAHVRRREFLARMRFIGSGFSRQISGANLLTGSGMGQLFENWEYAWTPATEAKLIELSLLGATLDEIVAARLRRLFEEPGDAATVAKLLTELAVMGETDLIPAVIAQLEKLLDEHSSLQKIITALATINMLMTESGRVHLGAQQPALRRLLEVGLAAVAYHLGTLALVADDAVAPACSAVLALRDLLNALERADSRGAPTPDGIVSPDLASSLSSTPPLDTSAPHRELARLLTADAPARLHGVLVGVAWTDNSITEDDLTRRIQAILHPGADPDVTSGFVLGLLEAAPDLAQHSDAFVEALNSRIAEFDDDAFLRVLPDLRQAFTWLRPVETAKLARSISALVGTTAADLDVVLNLDPALINRAHRIERDLLASLARDGFEGRTS